jgi:hypothetical protein
MFCVECAKVQIQLEYCFLGIYLKQRRRFERTGDRVVKVLRLGRNGFGRKGSNPFLFIFALPFDQVGCFESTKSLYLIPLQIVFKKVL